MRILVLLVTLACAACGAEEGGSHGGGDSNLTLWKIVNFAILGAGLGYLIAKNAPAFFRSRTEEIQRGIAEATRLREEAEARVAELERKMKGLAAEIEEIRRAAAGQIAAEGARIQAETAKALERAGEQGQLEIGSTAKSAQQELKALVAGLASQLAAEKIRAAMTPEVEEAMLNEFLAGMAKRRGDAEVH